MRRLHAHVETVWGGCVQPRFTSVCVRVGYEFVRHHEHLHTIPRLVTIVCSPVAFVSSIR